MYNMLNQDDKESCEKNTILFLAEEILLDLNNLNLINLLSLLSLLFKMNFKNDNIIQYLETDIFRANSYKITDFNSIVNIIEQNEKFQAENKKFNCIIEYNAICKNMFEHLDCAIKAGSISTANNLIDAINEFLQQKQDVILKATSQNQDQQGEFLTDYKKQYALSPTSGIALLNNNPYGFFVSKVLGLTPIDDWTNNVDARLQGEIVHQIMQVFAEKCRSIAVKVKQYDQLNKFKNDYEHIFNDIVESILSSNKIKINDFLKQKLKNIKNIAIQLEFNCAKNQRIVFVEKGYSHTINNIKIYARADRVEIDDNRKEIYIFDFKTGILPDTTQEKNGIKPQLSIIAMLILKLPQYKNYSIKKMQYIDLSGKENASNKIIDLNSIDDINKIETNIKSQIETFFKNGVPIIENMFYIKQTGQTYSQDIAIAKIHRDNFVMQ